MEDLPHKMPYVIFLALVYFQVLLHWWLSSPQLFGLSQDCIHIGF